MGWEREGVGKNPTPISHFFQKENDGRREIFTVL
jgi:hypothetical protein